MEHNKLRNDKICILITSKKSNSGIEITSDLTNKDLPLQSWLKPHRIFTIHESRIIKKLSSGNKELHKKITSKISELTKFN